MVQLQEMMDPRCTERIVSLVVIVFFCCFLFQLEWVPKFNNQNKISEDESATANSRYAQALFYIIIFVL